MEVEENLSVYNFIITDFIKYFPKILNDDICDNIVSDLQKGLSNTSEEVPFLKIQMSDDDKNFKYLSEAVKKGKQQYLKERPKYAEKYHSVSGENYGIYEDIPKKLIIQYYPTGGKMGLHIDNTGERRQYMENNRKIPDTERSYSQLSCLLYLNDNYEGGEFIVADQEYKTSKGSAIIFPSNFMFPHKVREVTKGKRWSVGVFLR